MAEPPEQGEPMRVNTDSKDAPGPEDQPVKLQSSAPGLDPPQPKASFDDYKIGEEVFALRSNGQWTPGLISEVQSDKVTVVLKEGAGVKQIRKEKMHVLLKRKEELSQPLKETIIANQNAALQVENARLAHENMMMRMQSQTGALNNLGGYPMGDPSMAGMDPSTYMGDPSMGFAMQDPHGYMRNPWGIPLAACPPSSFGEEGGSKKTWLSKSKTNTAGKQSFGKNSLNSTATASLGSAGGSFGQYQMDADVEPINALTTTLPHERTTIMMRNIPNNVTREQLINLVNKEGFLAKYDLLYLPIDLKKKVGLGYAFINFVTNDSAVAFTTHFTGFKDWNMKSEKICEVSWSDALQGLDEHVERYRDCPVMHESIPEEFKPALFKDGERIAFPEPTKRIRAPRPGQRRQ